MIQFNELKLTDKLLIIDASVKDLSYYENIKIKSVKIYTQNTFGDTLKDDYIYINELEETSRSTRLEINTSSIDSKIEGILFFIVIETEGTPSADTPCGMDNTITITAVFHNYFILCNLLGSILKHNNCEVNKVFIDLYMKYKGLVLAIKLKKWSEAIELFNLLYKKYKEIDIKTCGCNGTR
jgi:hypothetical protein